MALVLNRENLEKVYVNRTNMAAIKSYDDITQNLLSLQLEFGLSEEENDLLHIRLHNHALAAAACAHAVYFVSLLHHAREISLQPSSRPKNVTLYETAKKNLSVGIIGCGRLGRHLVKSLLSFGEVEPQHLHISTRQPETIVELKEKGIHCTQSNISVIQMVDIAFLCFLPAHLPVVTDELSGHIPPQTVIYSLLSAVPISQLQQLLATSNIIRPEMCIEHRAVITDSRWDLSVDVVDSLAVQRMVEQTCPVSIHGQQGRLVKTGEKFVVQLVYSVINLCVSLGFSSKQCVAVVNALFLGHTADNRAADIFKLQDFHPFNANDNVFQPFDLAQVAASDVKIGAKLQLKSVAESFACKYCFVFQQYIDNKNKAIVLSRKQILLAVGED